MSRDKGKTLAEVFAEEETAAAKKGLTCRHCGKGSGDGLPHEMCATLHNEREAAVPTDDSADEELSCERCGGPISNDVDGTVCEGEDCQEQA